MKKIGYSKGFTLVELLMVIAIIGIIGTIGFAAQVSAHEKAKIAKVQTEVKQVKTSLETYAINNGGYPNPTGTGSAYCIGSTDCEFKDSPVQTCVDPVNWDENCTTQMDTVSFDTTGFDTMEGILYIPCDAPDGELCTSADIIYPLPQDEYVCDLVTGECVSEEEHDHNLCEDVGVCEENPNDIDFDGIENASDNCPNDYNPDQDPSACSSYRCAGNISLVCNGSDQNSCEATSGCQWTDPYGNAFSCSGTYLLTNPVSCYGFEENTCTQMSGCTWSPMPTEENPGAGECSGYTLSQTTGSCDAFDESTCTAYSSQGNQVPEGTVSNTCTYNIPNWNPYCQPNVNSCADYTDENSCTNDSACSWIPS